LDCDQCVRVDGERVENGTDRTAFAFTPSEQTGKAEWSTPELNPATTPKDRLFFDADLKHTAYPRHVRARLISFIQVSFST
jgi:hypothetical protein